MTRRRQRIIMALGLAGIGLGVIGMISQLHFYHPSHTVPVLAMCTFGMMLLAIVLDTQGRTKLAVATLVLGTATIPFTAYLAHARARDRVIHAFDRGRAVNAAAIAVCDGTPNIAVDPAARRGLVVVEWSNDAFYVSSRSSTFHHATTLAELQLVVCRRSYDARCGGLEAIVIRDAKTASPLAEKTFGTSAPNCDPLDLSPRVEVVASTPPDEAEITAFIRRFVER